MMLNADLIFVVFSSVSGYLINSRDGGTNLVTKSTTT